MHRSTKCIIHWEQDIFILRHPSLLDRIPRSQKLPLFLCQERGAVLNFFLSLKEVQQNTNDHIQTEDVSDDVSGDEEERIFWRGLVAKSEVFANNVHSRVHDCCPGVSSNDEEQCQDGIWKVVKVVGGVYPLALSLFLSLKTCFRISNGSEEGSSAVGADRHAVVCASVERTLVQLNTEHAKSHKCKSSQEQTIQHHRERCHHCFKDDASTFNSSKETECTEGLEDAAG